MDSTLLYGIISIGAGVVVMIIKICFKSKCSDVSICYGLIHVERNVLQEIEEQKIDNSHPSPSRDSSLRNLGINNV
jgi:hypothetical protein